MADKHSNGLVFLVFEYEISYYFNYQLIQSFSSFALKSDIKCNHYLKAFDSVNSDSQIGIVRLLEFHF